MSYIYEYGTVFIVAWLWFLCLLGLSIFCCYLDVFLLLLFFIVVIVLVFVDGEFFLLLLLLTLLLLINLLELLKAFEPNCYFADDND